MAEQTRPSKPTAPYFDHPSGGSRLLPLLCYLPVLAVLLGLAWISWATDIPVSRLTRDTAAIAKLWPYTGAISQLGLQLWGVATFAAVATALFLRTIPPPASLDGTFDRCAIAFLFQAGLLTALLLVDDAFMVHEYSDRVTGLDNTVVLAGYGALAIALLWRHRHFLRRTNLAVLVHAIVFFAMSVLIDKLHDLDVLLALGVTSSDMRFLLEDGFKLLGISAWTYYLVEICYRALVARIRPA